MRALTQKRVIIRKELLQRKHLSLIAEELTFYTRTIASGGAKARCGYVHVLMQARLNTATDLYFSFEESVETLCLIHGDPPGVYQKRAFKARYTQYGVHLSDIEIHGEWRPIFLPAPSGAS